MSGLPRRLTLAVTAISLLSGVAAAWQVSDLLTAQHRRNGPLVSVPVAVAPIARGTRIDDAVLAESVTDRSVPRSFTPIGAVRSQRDLLGAVAAVDIPRGAYLTVADLSFTGSAGGAGFKLRRGERAVTIDAVVAPDGTELSPGSEIDLLASGIGGGSDTDLVIERAEVLVAGDVGEATTTSRKRITLRVSASHLSAVIRADAFAKEVRAVTVP
ncbi:MAG: hypothetical protein HY827_06215 [Actinobacteria bacterium]|nr:hypothetical protein [Actinomycetota bacterium]